MRAQWTELKYNGTRLIIPGGFSAEVFWKNDGYRVKFEVSELAATFSCFEEAKTMAIKLARKKLTMALESLSD